MSSPGAVSIGGFNESPLRSFGIGVETEVFKPLAAILSDSVAYLQEPLCRSPDFIPRYTLTAPAKSAL